MNPNEVTPTGNGHQPQDHFDEMMRRVIEDKEPQMLTKAGVVVAAVIPIEEYELLRRGTTDGV